MFKIEAKDNRLYALQRDYLTSGSVEIQKAEFIFSPEWDGFAKEVIFKIENGRAYSVVPDALNQCIIPWELLKTSDVALYVGVYGTKETQVMTTNYISLGKIHEGTDDSAEEPDPPPTPDIYRQLITMTETALKEVEELKDEAASGAFDGPPGPEGPQGAPGVDGKDGLNGTDGKDGEDGTDGVSPIIAVEDIEGGHQVTITDADGVKSFDVMDGETKIDESIKNGSILYCSLGSAPKEGDAKWFDKGSIVGRIPELGIPFLGILYDLSKDPDEIYLCQLVAIEEDRDDMMRFGILKIYNYPSSRIADLSNGTFIVAPSSNAPNVGDNYNYDRTRIIGLIPNVDDTCRGILYTNSSTYLCSFAVRNVTSSGTVTAVITSVQSLSGSSDDGLPVGTIVMWHGTQYNVPAKWHICDGTNNTPDLRGRFVLGVSDAHTKGSKGGEETVKLKVNNLPSHDHKMPLNGGSGGGSMHYVCANAGIGDTTNLDTSLPVRSVGDNVAHNNMPPYYALFYIMKVEV